MIAYDANRLRVTALNAPQGSYGKGGFRGAETSTESCPDDASASCVWSIASKIKLEDESLDAVKDAIRRSRVQLDAVCAISADVLARLKATQRILVAALQSSADARELPADVASTGECTVRSLSPVEVEGTMSDKVDVVMSYEAVGKGTSSLEADLAVGLLKMPRDHARAVQQQRANSKADPRANRMKGDRPRSDVAHADHEILQVIEVAVECAEAEAARFVGYRALLDAQDEFIGVLTNSLTAGVSAFVDNDASAAWIRFEALQSQQQLGANVLPIVNKKREALCALLQ